MPATSTENSSPQTLYRKRRSSLRDRTPEIRSFLLKNIPAHPRDIAELAMKKFKVVRSTVHRHLKWMHQNKVVIQTGSTRGTSYYLKSALNKETELPLTPDMEELPIWEEHLKENFSILPQNVFEICRYGFSRSFKNVLEHSLAKTVTIRTQWEADSVTLTLEDDGVGIFKNIQIAFNLENEKAGALLLARGKLPPAQGLHYGQGLFFCSRSMDRFVLSSGNLRYTRTARDDDWFLETQEDFLQGTQVSMEIHLDTPRKITEVFSKYSTYKNVNMEEDSHLGKTHLEVKKLSPGESACATREQAKKLLRGIGKFKHVVLDFTDVHLVSQGFVDEVFRVFQSKYPGIHIATTHANEDVQFMIQNALPSPLAGEAPLGRGGR